MIENDIIFCVDFVWYSLKMFDKISRVDPLDDEVQRHGSSSKKNRGDAIGYHVTMLGSH